MMVLPDVTASVPSTPPHDCNPVQALRRPAVRLAVSLMATVLLPSLSWAATVAQVSAEPRFMPGPCWFTVPEGQTAVCGTITVPDRRDRPATRQFRLPVAMLHATTRQPVSDPVLFLEGGPGASPFGSGEGIEERMEGWWSLTEQLRRNRSVLLFDPRGAGRGEPDMDCSELDVLSATPQPEPQSKDQRAEAEAAAIRICADRFTASGLDGAMFTSPVAADDAIDVINALNINRVNLFAVSYGTRVALEIIRRHPNRVRTAVLDSVYPPDVNALEEGPWLAQRAYRQLFDDCAANRNCRAAYPDLERRFLGLVTDLQAKPRDVQIGDPALPQVVRMDGASLLAAGIEAMASGVGIARLPAMIQDATGNKLDRLATMAPTAWLGDPETADALAFAIECRETANPADQARLQANGERNQPYNLLGNDDPSRRVCSMWPAAVQEPAERMAVASGTTPVLLLSGSYDPVTPPAWAERASRTLANSRHIEFRGSGHVVISNDDCAMTAAAQFIETESVGANVCPSAAKPPSFETH